VKDYISPNWDTAALVVIDMQRDVLDYGALPVPGTSAVVPEVTALIEAFRAAGRPVAHVVRLYAPRGSDVDPPRRDAIEQGAYLLAPFTEGAEPAEGLLPDGVRLDADLLLSGALQQVSQREVVLFKPRWSAFYRTQLEQWLREDGVDTVVVAGCNLPNCPRATLFDASERDFRAVLAVDAVSQTTDERLFDLERIGVNLVGTAAILEVLRPA
jgi:nicotinamidase-related amidase